jgi:hypothetical protein
LGLLGKNTSFESEKRSESSESAHPFGDDGGALGPCNKMIFRTRWFMRM